MNEASETLSGVHKFEIVRYKFEMVWYIYIYIYIYICVCVCHNSSACHAYMLWAELGHNHFCMGKCNVGGFMRQPF